MAGVVYLIQAIDELLFRRVAKKGIAVIGGVERFVEEIRKLWSFLRTQAPFGDKGDSLRSIWGF